MTNNLKEQIQEILSKDVNMLVGAYDGKPVFKPSTLRTIEGLVTLINQKEKESEIRALEGLLDSDADEVTCICESASTEVCDHNWSLCNVVRDRIKQLKEELKGGKE